MLKDIIDTYIIKSTMFFGRSKTYHLNPSYICNVK